MTGQTCVVDNCEMGLKRDSTVVAFRCISLRETVYNIYVLSVTILALTCLHKKYSCCYGDWEGLCILMPFEEIYSKAPIYHKFAGETADAHLWWCFHFCSQGLYVIYSCWNSDFINRGLSLICWDFRSFGLIMLWLVGHSCIQHLFLFFAMTIHSALTL